MGKVSSQETVNIDVANVKEARIVSGSRVQQGNGSVLFRLIPEGSFKLEIKKYKSKKTLYEKKFIGNELELEVDHNQFPESKSSQSAAAATARIRTLIAS